MTSRRSRGAARSGARLRPAAPRSPSPRRVPHEPSAPARARFLAADAYRSGREWDRYAGTAQRDLFRQLRERFLSRHPGAPGPGLDAGSGPGRFTAALGGERTTRRVALDLSHEMLRELRDRWGDRTNLPRPPDLVLGDAVRPPFPDGAFGLVAGLGNLVGFAGARSADLVESLARLVAPEGTLVLEVAPGPGERSRYFRRLPARSVARLLRSAPALVAGRADREGYSVEPWRKERPGAFERPPVAEVGARLERLGFRPDEVLAVAPALGPDPERIREIAGDPKAWAHLLAVEERLGRSPERWRAAAAVLMAATRVARPRSRAESEG